MKTVKKVAAIISIVASSFMTFFLIDVVTNRLHFNSGWDMPSIGPGPSRYGRLFAITALFLTISIIVLSSILCNKKRKDTGIVISLLIVIPASVAMAILTSNEIRSWNNPLEGTIVIYSMIMIAVTTLLTIYLIQVIRGNAKQDETTIATTDSPANQPTTCGLESKLNILKQLKDEGTITQAEYKKRALEIIDTGVTGESK